MKRNRLGRVTAANGLCINGTPTSRRRPASKGNMSGIRQDSPLREVRIEMVDETGATVSFDNHDLNPIGVYLYSDFLYFEGETLQLRLHLPTAKEPLPVVAQVDHANLNANPGMGVTFRNLSDQTREHLKNYVRSRQEKHGP